MSVSDEKKTDFLTENMVAVTNDADDFRLLTAETRNAGERALVRKLDRWLIPTAVVIHLLNNIDVCHHPFMTLGVLTFLPSVPLLVPRGWKVYRQTSDCRVGEMDCCSTHAYSI